MSSVLGFVWEVIKQNPRFIATRRQVARLQERRLRQLLRTSAARSPFHQRRFTSLDLDRCRLSDLPVMTKEEMMHQFDDVVTDRELSRAGILDFMAEPSHLGQLYLGRYGVSHTSGSQGQPALIVQDERALSLAFSVQAARGSTRRGLATQHASRFLSPARMALVTLKPGFYPSGASFSNLPVGLRPFLKLQWFSVLDPLEATVDSLNAFRPNYLTGYASALEMLTREEEAGRLRLGPTGSLEQVTNVSEPMPQSLRRRIEQSFGVPVADHYALGECPALTVGCPLHCGSHVNADLAIIEVVDERYRPVPDGERGAKLLLTNLYNHVQPFIRYEIDDMVTMSASPCPCGSALPHIASIEGRSRDKLWVETNGRARELPSYFFVAALQEEAGIAEHQVVQTGLNAFCVRAAALEGRSLEPDHLQNLVRGAFAREGIATPIRLAVEIVGEIPRGPSGKAIRLRNAYKPFPAAA